MEQRRSGSIGTARKPFGFRFVAPIAFGATLNPINSSLIATAMVPIAQSFGVTSAETAWLITSLYLSSAVAQPTMGKLADLLGPRRVYVAALSLVAVTGVIGPLATSLAMLVVTRVLVGIGTSGAYPAAMRLFRERGLATGAPPPRTAMGILSLSAQSVAAIGPVAGGLLTAAFGWHAVFAVNLPLAIGAMTFILLWTPADAPRPPRETSLWAELDVVGLLLFTACLSAAMIVLMHLAAPDWRAMLAAASFGLGLVVWSLRCPNPFIDVRLLVGNLPLTITYLRSGAILMIGYCMFYGFAQWTQAAGGYSPRVSGLMAAPMSIVAAGASIVAARTRSIRTPFVLACGAALAGSGLLIFTPHTASPWLLAAGAALFGVPMGMTSTATQAAVYVQAPAETIGSASGLQRTFGYLGSITSASLLAYFFADEPSDAGFHGLMLLLALVSGGLLAAVSLDPTIPRMPGGHRAG